MTVSAGNDGPGLGTIGFPGSAARVVSVGATFPLVFLRRPAFGGPAEDPLAFFSSRGGGHGSAGARPDLVAPGVAYSTVPRWDTGNERNAGTSMASPHVAGLAARLISYLAARDIPFRATAIKRALMVTARPLEHTGYLDDGTGMPNLSRALAWLSRDTAAAGANANSMRGAVPTASILVESAGDGDGDGDGAGDTVLVAVPVDGSPGGSGQIDLKSRALAPAPAPAPWIELPATVAGEDSVRFGLVLRPEGLQPGGGGFRSAVVTGWHVPGGGTGAGAGGSAAGSGGGGKDGAAGPAFRLVISEIAPVPAGRDARVGPVTLAAGGTHRMFFRATEGRPFQVRVSTVSAFERMFTSLHEPGGRTYRGENGLAAGPDDEAAVYQVDGRDAVSGVYEIASASSPVAGGRVSVELRRSPFELHVHPEAHGVTVTAANVTTGDAGGLLRLALVGGARGEVLHQAGGAEYRAPVMLPAWTGTLEVDVSMPPAQWNRFTDFGVTLLDSAGRIVADQALNYSIGRLRFTRERDDSGGTPGATGEPLTLALLPALADAADSLPWEATLDFRFYAGSAVPLAPEGAGRASAARVPWPAGRIDSVSFRLPASPWPLGPGMAPLGIVIMETDGPTWTTEVALPPPPPPSTSPSTSSRETSP